MTKASLVKYVTEMRDMIEASITTATVNGKNTNSKNVPYANGQKAKEALIRSQLPIFRIHEYVKSELAAQGVPTAQICPGIEQRDNEIKLTGYFKSKDQDVCVVPTSISSKPQKVNWGVLATENVSSTFGPYKEERILATNVRSQLSSLSKNTDTLFERMIAEAFNLHRQYPKLVLGELYMIPLHEYDDNLMLQNKIGFKPAQTNLEKYITFFNSLNSYSRYPNDQFRYNRAALIIADFSSKQPRIFETTEELKNEGLVSKKFNSELHNLSPYTYVQDLLSEYKKLVPHM